MLTIIAHHLRCLTGFLQIICHIFTKVTDKKVPDKLIISSSIKASTYAMLLLEDLYNVNHFP